MKAKARYDSQVSTLHLVIDTVTRPLVLFLVAVHVLTHSFALAIFAWVLVVKGLAFGLGFLMPGSAARRRYEVERQALQRKFEHNVSPEYRLQELELQMKHGLPAREGLFGLIIGVTIRLLRGYGYFGLWYVLICAAELHGGRLLWIPDMTAPDPKYLLPLAIFCLFAGDIVLSRRNPDLQKSYGWFVILLPPGWAGLNAFLPAGLCFYHLISFWLKPLVNVLSRIPRFLSERLGRRDP